MSTTSRLSLHKGKPLCPLSSVIFHPLPSVLFHPSLLLPSLCFYPLTLCPPPIVLRLSPFRPFCRSCQTFFLLWSVQVIGTGDGAAERGFARRRDELTAEIVQRGELSLIYPAQVGCLLFFLSGFSFFLFSCKNG